jgi:6-pyruvoyltetrahydropterin/6-carboxytetrahydropterin synthase
MNFSSAHFVQGAEECECLHGHNYRLSLIIEGEVNNLGMVIDFREVKQQAVKVCKQLDHKTLLPTDSGSITVSKSDESVEVLVGEKRYVFPIEDCVLLPLRATTAELLAEYLAKQLVLPDGCSVQACVSENEGSSGCYRSVQVS